MAELARVDDEAAERKAGRVRCCLDCWDASVSSEMRRLFSLPSSFRSVSSSFALSGAMLNGFCWGNFPFFAAETVALAFLIDGGPRRFGKTDDGGRSLKQVEERQQLSETAPCGVQQTNGRGS